MPNWEFQKRTWRFLYNSNLELFPFVSEPESRPSSDTSNPADDAHVCGKCRQEFIGLTEFLAHKKVCSRKRVLVLYDAEAEPENSESLADDNLALSAKVPKLSDISDFNNCVNEGGSDGECDDDIDDNFDDDDNEIMDAEDREIANEEIDEDLIKISMMNAQQDDDMSDDDEEEEEDDGDSNNNDKNRDDGKIPEISKTSFPPHLNPFMFPFLPNSNVVLEPISATRAAVAQFAENNMSPKENTVLQSTLYNLQQQQILQLQLIHQLQQQIVVGMHPPLPGNHMPMLPTSLPPEVLSRSLKFDSSDLPEKLTKDSAEEEEKIHKEDTGIDGSKPETETVSKEDHSPTAASTSVSMPSAFPLPSTSMTPTTPPTSEFAKLTKRTYTFIFNISIQLWRTLQGRIFSYFGKCKDEKDQDFFRLGVANIGKHVLHTIIAKKVHKPKKTVKGYAKQIYVTLIRGKIEIHSLHHSCNTATWKLQTIYAAYDMKVNKWSKVVILFMETKREHEKLI